MPGSYETLALLLDRVPYRDADLIVTLLTRDHGLVPALARGARGSRRRFAGSLDLFLVARVRVQPRAPGALATLCEAEAETLFPGILDSLDRLEAGACLLALARDLLRDAPAGETAFRALAQALGRLQFLEPEAVHLAILDLVLALLDDVGHGVDPEACPSCRASLADGAALGPDGTVCCPRCAPAGLPVPSAVLTAMADLAAARSVRVPGRADTLAFVAALVSGVLGRPYRLAIAWETGRNR